MSGSSTTITLASLAEFNNDTGSNYIAYCFNSVENFSSFGSYTGNGSAAGPIVETGFEPAFLMVKELIVVQVYGLFTTTKEIQLIQEINYYTQI